MAASRHSGRRRLRRAALRLGLRRRDVAALRSTAAVGVVLSALALALLVTVGAMLFRTAAPRRTVPELRDLGCAEDRIQSLESWTLARLEREPVKAPRKQRWEGMIGDANLRSTALRDRLVGWPTRLLAEPGSLPRSAPELARRVAADTWRGLSSLTDREHGLPLDTITFGNGSVDVGHATIGDYTSTTNIGMHLIAAVAASDLGLITEAQAREQIGRTLDTLEHLETDDGRFYNYYDTTTLERTSDFVSFVDSGWLTAGLMVVRMRFPELYPRCAALIDGMDYGAFYDSGYDLVSHGYFVHPRGGSRYHYGVLYTEARLGVLIAIGKGDVPESAWFEMVRTFPASCRWQTLTPVDVETKTVLGHTFTAGHYRWGGMRYVPSWGGSMFEALMPTLVLDESTLAPNSLGANGRAHVLIQHRYATRDLGLPVWGLSPSAKPGTDQYGEYGVRMLGSLGYPVGPVTPHASALALGILPHAALANLRRLAARYDVYGEYGFYDAVDPVTEQVAYKYLTLDQSMVFIALANHLADGSVQKRFASDPIVQRVLPLLAAENFFD